MMTNNDTNESETITTEYMNIDKSAMTLERLVETEMLQLGLDPRDENDRLRFWSEKGLTG
jgi:hypothetical protein